MSWLTAPRWQMTWGCFRSFALHRIRVLPDLMMDTHRCIAIGRNCLLFRTTRVHFRFIGSSCCSCAFVIFCVISVGCCWFVSVLPWFVFCPRLLFVDNPFGCKRLFVSHNKSSNGTFLLGCIMINIPLGKNITIKVPVDIIFHNISFFGSYIMVELIFRHTVFLFPSDGLISTGNHLAFLIGTKVATLIGKCIKNIVDIFGFIQIQRFLRSIVLCSANQSWRPIFFQKMHRQKNATLVQYGKWLNSGLTEWW